MDLQFTLQRYALQLKNQPRTLKRVARVFQKIMKTLYATYFPNAEARRPGPNPNCPDADILTVASLLEYIGEDSENSGYQRLKTQLKTVFPSLPERSRFNRRRRNLSPASEVIRRALTTYLPKTDVFIVDSFPIPVCDFKRAKASKSDFKWADGTGTYATYGHCATGLFSFKHLLYLYEYNSLVGGVCTPDFRELWLWEGFVPPISWKTKSPCTVRRKALARFSGFVAHC